MSGPPAGSFFAPKGIRTKHKGFSAVCTFEYSRSSLEYSRRMRALVRAWYATLLLISLAALAGAVWTHVEALRGVDPRGLFPDIWALQLLLNLLIIPLIIAFFRKGLGPQIRQFPRWCRILISVLAAYYSFHF